MSATPDRIEKTITLRAPLERVWSAISDAKQFGAWFGVTFDGPFEPGKPMRGKMTPTKVSTEVAELQKPYEGQAFNCTVERIEPRTLFSFRWHPFAIEPNVDYSQEPTTLVVFTLEEVDGGTKVTIVESGFDRIPLARRASAFTANEGGWEHQTKLLEAYVLRYAG